MMKVKTQFDQEPKLIPVCNPDYCTPIEGFLPGQSEPLSVLVRRLTLGQAVPVIGSGVYGQDQIFESEMIDRFDVMDRCSDLREAVAAGRQGAATRTDSSGLNAVFSARDRRAAPRHSS